MIGMARIKIVTDSTSDMLPTQVADYGIEVIPLNVHFGDEVYKDGVDITPDQFYTKLKSAQIMPRTSQPSAGEFMELYKELAADADAIISVHISSHLSGTLASAETARGLVDIPVVAFDSRSASQGCARLAMLAARAAKAGLGVDEIVALLEKTRAQTMLVFSVDTLEYLQKNGRIGRAQALLGSIMQVKPLLYIDPEGINATLDKVRSRSRVIPRLVEAAHERFPLGSRVEVSVIHAGAEDRAKELLGLAVEGYDVVDVALAPIGPVIGAHAGPGALGLIMLPRVEF
jgi:DegV family protein with EDD domain